MWSIALAAAATAHVPIYPSGSSYTVDRNADISQVIYSPGANLGVVVPTEFFPEDKKLNIDIIVRDKADMSKLKFSMLCGTKDLSPTELLQPGKLEAFTQTSYFSLFEGHEEDDHRVGPELDLSVCGTSPLAISVGHMVNHEEIGPVAIVIGHKEEFTFGELMSFGHYALMNHGYWWNEAGWTYWSLLAIVGLVVIVSLYAAAAYDARAPTAFDDRLRETLYWVAIVGFGAAILEGIVHIGIAQVDVPVEGELGIALVIVLLPNLFAMGIIFLNLYYTSEKIQTPVWAPLEFVTAFSMFLLFSVRNLIPSWCTTTPINPPKPVHRPAITSARVSGASRAWCASSASWGKIARCTSSIR
jgi:hypothetical protein